MSHCFFGGRGLDGRLGSVANYNKIVSRAINRKSSSRVASPEKLCSTKTLNALHPGGPGRRVATAPSGPFTDRVSLNRALREAAFPETRGRPCPPKEGG